MMSIKKKAIIVIMKLFINYFINFVGMVESIVAAACSRIGKNVLHLDSSDHYGGLWASYNFEGLQKFIKDVITDPQKQTQVYNLSEQWYIEK